MPKQQQHNWSHHSLSLVVCELFECKSRDSEIPMLWCMCGFFVCCTQQYLHCDCNLQFLISTQHRKHIFRVHCCSVTFSIRFVSVSLVLIFEVAFLIWNFIKFMTRLTFSPLLRLIGLQKSFQNIQTVDFLILPPNEQRWVDRTEAKRTSALQYVCWFGSVKLISTAKPSELGN